MEGKQKDAENGRGVHHGHLHQSRKPSSSSVAKSDTSLVLLPRQPLLLHQRVLGRVKQILPRFPWFRYCGIAGKSRAAPQNCVCALWRIFSATPAVWKTWNTCRIPAPFKSWLDERSLAELCDVPLNYYTKVRHHKCNESKLCTGSCPAGRYSMGNVGLFFPAPNRNRLWPVRNHVCACEYFSAGHSYPSCAICAWVTVCAPTRFVVFSWNRYRERIAIFGLLF